MFTMDREKISSFALRGFHGPKFEECSKKRNVLIIHLLFLRKFFPNIFLKNLKLILELITFRLNECSSRWNLRRYSNQTESVDLQCSINIR